MMQELNYIRCGDYYIPDITRQSARLGGMNLYLRLQLKMPASQAW